MRPLEVVLLVTTVLAAGAMIGAKRPKPSLAVVALALPVPAAVVQWLVEGPRWQLLPLQLAATVIMITSAAALLRRSPVPAQRSITCLTAVLVAIGGGLAWALPVAELPPPQGRSAVGTVSLTVTDPVRSERFGPVPRAPRQVVIQVWYPADPHTAAEPVPLVSNTAEFWRTAAEQLDLPRFTLDHLTLVHSHATELAPPDPRLPKQLPVVLYSHAWSGLRSAQHDLLQSLASHGYAVIAVDHTFGALATTFPDGRVAALDPAALPEERVQDAEAALVSTFAADLVLVLDHLADNEIAPLEGRFDLDRVALLGHEAGGGAAVLACAKAVRCGAVVTFDPRVSALPDEVIGAGLDVPLLSIRSEEWANRDVDARLRRLHAASDAHEGRVEIRGARHHDFTLLPLLTPLAPNLGLSGDTPGQRTREIVDEWTRRFLDHHLRGQGTDPLLVPPEHAECRLEKAPR